MPVFDAQQFHYEKHFTNKIQCGTCDFKMDTRAKLRQHVVGAHGLGIKSFFVEKCSAGLLTDACIKINARSVLK